MKALLHIGTEKTGTTTIQHFLAKNREVLLEDGFLYPHSPGKENHSKLAAYALEAEKIQDVRKYFKITDRDKVLKFRSHFSKKLAQELKKNNPETVIFSNEHCSSRLITKEEIERLKTLLEQFFDDITIIIYLRRQDKYLLSSYSTAVLAGRTEPFCLPSQDSIESRYDYWNVLQKWESVFGKENIVVRLFEREQMVNGDLLSDLIEVLGINPTKKYKNVTTLNQSLDAGSLELLRFINLFIPKFIGNDINQKRLGLLKMMADYSQQHLSKNNLSMSKTMMEEFMSNFEESNKKVANYYLDRPDGKLFMNDFHNEKVKPAQRLTIEQVFKFVAYLVREKVKQTWQTTNINQQPDRIGDRFLE